MYCVYIDATIYIHCNSGQCLGCIESLMIILLNFKLIVTLDFNSIGCGVDYLIVLSIMFPILQMQHTSCFGIKFSMQFGLLVK